MTLAGWLDTTFSARVALTLVHFLWQGILLAAVAGLAASLLRHAPARARYGVFLIAMCLMAACPPATYYALHSQIAQVAAPATRHDAASRLLAHKPALPAADIRLEEDGSGAAVGVVDRRDRHNAVRSGSLAIWTPRLWTYITAGYFLGVTMMLGRLFLALYGGRRLRRQSVLVQEPDLLTAVSRIAGRLKLAYTPTVAFCERVAVPTLVGALRPILLLPLSFTSGLEPSQIEAILAHELAHLRRHDHIVNLLQRVIEALLFFHPALWYVSRRVRIERENCCDDRAIGLAMDPLLYAASLVRVAEAALAHPKSQRSLSAASLAAVQRPSDLSRRIRRITAQHREPPLRLMRTWPAVLTAGLLALAVPLTAAWSTGANSATTIEHARQAARVSGASITTHAGPPASSDLVPANTSAELFRDGAGEETTHGRARVRYTGIEPAYAEAIAALVDAAWQVLDWDFSFDLPDMVTVIVDCRPTNELRLWNDGQERIYLSLRSAEQLRQPKLSGVFNVYGMCHEMGHIAMYRTLDDRQWLTSPAAEGWADYCGAEIVDRVRTILDDDLWPDPYDYSGDGMARLESRLASPEPPPSTVAAGRWGELVRLVGEERMSDVLTAWNDARVDIADPAPALREALLLPYEGTIRIELDAWFTRFAAVAVAAVQPSETKPKTIDRGDLSRKPETLKYDDDASDGKKSIAGGGHVVFFDAPDDKEWYVTRVQLFGSRYGYPRAPNEDVKITLCDENLKPITTWKRRYRTFQRGNPKWHPISVPPTLVPGRFGICFDFNPAATKGVYVHFDDSSSGHSAVGLPGKEPRDFDDGDWMIRVELDKAKSTAGAN